ncbi:MAG: ABC transporter ATP-binding protein [Eubacteriales bacterium]
MKIIQKMLVLLSKRQKIELVGLLFVMLIGAILETASIALIIPVVTLIMTPDAATSNQYLVWITKVLNIQDERTLTILVMLSLVVAFTIKNSFIFMQQKWLYHFIYTNQFRTSRLLMRNYVNRGYEFYLNVDTAVIQRNITADVNNMYSLILAVLTLISEMIILGTLGIVLMVADFKMTTMMVIVLLITLLLIKIRLKPTLHRAGEEHQHHYSLLFKWIAQTVTGIKEVKIMGKENYFVGEYEKCGRGYVAAVQKYSLYSNTPRLLIETVFMSTMVLYMLVIILTNHSMDDMLPILSVFAFAAARLMPCANRINNQLNNIAYFEPFFMGVSDDLQEQASDKCDELHFATKDTIKMPLTKEIRMEDITYAYPNTETNIFTKASMEIPIGSAVGVVGTSGSGKSTIIDVLLGLLEVQEGKIYGDGIDIQTNYQGWLKNIGYIPQMIFMLDDTIRRNVAFGVVDEEIDEEQVWHVLREAQLDGFIRTLPDGLDTAIGERGIRLSGGQRQRIGIARALYNDPEVLVLDEATSALDNDTEAAIMQSINQLHGKKTLLIIAHRLQTIAQCDRVYRVENEKITLER